MKVYRAVRYDAKIIVMDASRVTEQSVFFAGEGRTGKERREAMVSGYTRYFLSWEDAHVHVLAKAEQRVEAYELNLASAKAHLETVRGLRKPEE